MYVDSTYSNSYSAHYLRSCCEDRPAVLAVFRPSSGRLYDVAVSCHLSLVLISLCSSVG
jgi:hypothetical protein